MNLKNNLLVLSGAVIGGVLGHIVFLWLVHQGIYGLILPGGLTGLGAGIFKTRSIIVAIACGIFALLLGFFTEWRFAPFAADSSLGYFVTHLDHLRPITLIMIAIGAFIGFWVPFRRRQEARNAP